MSPIAVCDETHSVFATSFAASLFRQTFRRTWRWNADLDKVGRHPTGWRRAVPRLKRTASEMSKSPLIARTVPTLRRVVDGFRSRRTTVALVPTMGALHD